MTTELLTPKEAAARLRVTTETLEQWRGRLAGPPWIKLGTSKQSPIRYRLSEIEKYLQERECK